jgi:predicted SprT family Zn-dependent metalloprotease
MDLNTAERWAREHLERWGLKRQGWTFAFDRARKRFGSCQHARRRITLSAPLTRIAHEEDVLDTIRHEIAHALAGPRAGHGVRWRAIAAQVGAKPQRLGDGPTLQDGNYVARCPSCAREYHRYRKPKPGMVYLCRFDRTPLRFDSTGSTASAASA